MNCNHGHLGIFMGDRFDRSESRFDTFEASGGVGRSSAPGGKAGVMRRQNWGKYDSKRKGKVRLRNVRKFSVNATPDQRHRAAMWAASKAGQGYDNPGRPLYTTVYGGRCSPRENVKMILFSHCVP